MAEADGRNDHEDESFHACRIGDKVMYMTALLLCMFTVITGVAAFSTDKHPPTAVDDHITYFIDPLS